ncbi:MAG: hypothetical protein AB1Z57_03645 [Acidimicrobiia bacterium]
MWTDDLAARLVAAGIVDDDGLGDWREWPVALHLPATEDQTEPEA